MTLAQLKSELEQIKGEADLLVESAPAKKFDAVSLPRGRALGAVKADTTRRTGVRNWVRKLLDGLLEMVRKALCCKGLTQIDSEEERAAVTEKLVKAILTAVPAQYKLLIPLFKPLLRRAVRKVVDYLATQGERMCEGVTCSLSPLAIS